MVSKHLTAKLRAIIQEDYGRALDDKQVSLIANTLVEYFDLLAKMYHQDKNDNQLKNEYEKYKQGL